MKKAVMLMGPVVALLLQSCAQPRTPTAGAACAPTDGPTGVKCWYQYVDSGAGEQVLKCVYKQDYNHTHSHRKAHTHTNNVHPSTGTFNEPHNHRKGSACL